MFRRMVGGRPGGPSGRGYLLLATVLLVVAGGALAPSSSAGGAAGEPAIGYWTDSNAVIADEAGKVVRTFPNFDHFSFNRSLLAGELEGRRRYRDRVVGFDPGSGERLFRIRNAMNPMVAPARPKVAFFPTVHRDEYIMSVWVRNASGAIRKVIQFKPGPGPRFKGVPHGMEAGGGPLDMAFNRDGRYMAVTFGLETIHTFDVWIVDVKTKKATRMTRGENSRSPSLSPDGSRLAVRVERNDGCSDPVYGKVFPGKVRVLSRTTGESETLSGYSCDVIYDTPRWLDNDTLLVSRATRDSSEPNGWDTDILQVDATTGTVTTVLEEGNPCCMTVSPALKKVAHMSTDSGGFWVRDLGSGTTLEFGPEHYAPHLQGEGRL